MGELGTIASLVGTNELTLLPEWVDLQKRPAGCRRAASPRPALEKAVGYAPILRKPFRPVELAEAVRTSLDR